MGFPEGFPLFKLIFFLKIEKCFSECNWTRTPNHLVHKGTLSLTKWLSVRLRTKWLWVRVQLQSLILINILPRIYPNNLFFSCFHRPKLRFKTTFFSLWICLLEFSICSGFTLTPDIRHSKI